MKALISTLILLSSFTASAQIIAVEEAYSVTTAREYLEGFEFKLNANGVCQKITRKRDFIKGELRTKIKNVELLNCKADLIAQKVRETLGGNCTPSSNVQHSGDSNNSLLKRAKQEIFNNSLTENCTCQHEYAKRVWVSNAENILIYSVTSLFDGPRTEDKTVFTLLERDECAELAETSEESDAIKAAYDTFR